MADNDFINLSVDAQKAIQNITQLATNIAAVNTQISRFTSFAIKTGPAGQILRGSFNAALNDGKELALVLGQVDDATSKTGKSIGVVGLKIKEATKSWGEQVNAARAALAAALAYNKGQGSSVDELEAKYAKLGITYRDVLKAAKTQIIDKVPLRTQREDTHKQIKDVEQQIQIVNAPKERAALQEFIDESEVKLKGFKAKLIKRDEEVAKLQEVIDTARKEFTKLDPKLFDTTGAELTELINYAQKEIDKLNIVNYTKEEKRLLDLIDGYQARIRKLDLIDSVKEQNRLKAVIAQAQKDLEFDFDDKKLRAKFQRVINDAQKKLDSLEKSTDSQLAELKGKLAGLQSDLSKLKAPASLEQLLGIKPETLIGFDAGKLSAFENALDAVIRQVVYLQGKKQSITDVVNVFGTTGVKRVQEFTNAQNQLLVLLGKVHDVIGDTESKIGKQRAARQKEIEGLLTGRGVLGPQGGNITIPQEARNQQELLRVGLPAFPAPNEDAATAAQRKAIFADVQKYILNASNKEVETVKKAQDEIRKYLTQNTDIGKQQINELFTAVGKGTVSSLHQSVQGLLPLINNLDAANQRLGQSTQTVSARAAYAQTIIDKAKKLAAPPPDASNDAYTNQLRQVNGQLLAVSNQATKLKKPLNDIDEIFAAAKDRRPYANTNTQAVALYSTLATLFAAHDKLVAKIKATQDAEIALAEATKRGVAEEIAEIQKRIAVQQFAGKFTGGLPAGDIGSDFDKKTQLVERYRKAIFALEDEMIKQGITEAGWARIRQAIAQPNVRFDPGTEKLRSLFNEQANAYFAIGKAADKAANQVATSAAKRLQAENKATRALISQREEELARQASQDLARTYLNTQLPTVAAATPVEDFSGKEQAVKRYQRALLTLNEVLNRVKVNDDILKDVDKLIHDPTAQASEAAKTLAKTLLSATTALNTLQNGAKKKITVDLDLRLADINAALDAAVGKLDFAGVEKKAKRAFLNARDAVAKAYLKSDITPTELTPLIAKTQDPLTRADTVTKYAALDAALRKLFDSIQAVDSGLIKTGEAALKVARTDFSQQFLKAEGTAKDLDNVLTTLGTGFPIAKFESLYVPLQRIINESQALGRSFDQEKVLIQAALQAEIAAIKQAADAEADAEQRRKDRQAKRQTDKAKEIADTTLEQQRRFPTVEAAFTRPDVGKGFTLPANIRPEQFSAINSALQAVNAHLIQANISDQVFNNTLKETRQALASPAKTFFANVHPDIEKLRTLISSVDKEMGKVGRGAAEAGNAILISWRGVFRLFQAQVLHTAIGQIIAEFRQAIFEVGNFQKEIGLVQTITQDLFNANSIKGASQNFKEWASSINEVAIALGKTPTEVSAAAYNVLSNQITNSRQETEDFVRVAGEFARTTGSDLPQAVDLASGVIHAFGKSGQDAEKIYAGFFTTIDYGNIKAEELASNFGRVASLAKPLGVSLEEIQAALITITQQGINATTAQTGLSNVFIKLLRPTKETKELFKELNVATGDQLIRTRGLGGALQALAKASEEGKGDLTDIFNEIRGAQAGLILAENGAERFNDALRKVSDPQNLDRFRTAKRLISEPAGVEFLRQINELKVLITEEIGGKAAQAIVDVTKAFGGLGTIGRASFHTLEFGVNAAVESMHQLHYIAPVAFGTALVFNWSSAVATGTAAVTTLSSGLNVLIVKITAAFAANPVLAFAAAVAAVGVAIGTYIAYEARAAERRKELYAEGVAAAHKAANETSKAFNESIDRTTQGLKESVRDQIGMFADWSNKIKGHAEDVSEKLKNLAHDARDSMQVSFEGLISGFKEGIDEIKNREKAAQDAVKNINRFKRESGEEGERRQFRRDIQEAPPGKQIAVGDERVRLLYGRAQALFDTRNYEEGIRLLKEADDILQDQADKFVKLHSLQEKLNQKQNVNQYVNSFKTPPQVTARLNPKYLSALRDVQQHQDDTGFEDPTKRLQALERLNNVAKTLYSAPKARQQLPDRGIIEQQLKIKALIAQTYAIGVDEETITRKIVFAREAEKLILEQVASAAAKNAEVANAQQETLNANLKSIQLDYKELAKIKIFKDSGELVPQKELERSKARIDELQGRIISAFQKQAEMQEAFAPGTVQYDKLLDKITQFKKQVDAVKDLNNQQILNQGNIDQNKKLEAQVIKTGEVITKAIEEIVETQKRYNKEAQTGIELAKLWASEIGKTPKVYTARKIFYPPDATSLTDALAKGPENALNALKEIDKYLDKIRGTPLEFAPGAGFDQDTKKVLNLTEALEQERTKLLEVERFKQRGIDQEQVRKDTELARQRLSLPQGPVINDPTKTYLQILDQVDNKIKLIDRDVAAAIQKISDLRDKQNALAPTELQRLLVIPKEIKAPEVDKETLEKINQIPESQMEKIPSILKTDSESFEAFANRAGAALVKILDGINAVNNAAKNMQPGVAPVKNAVRRNMGGYLASGGLVPVMTTPGEIFIAPGLASKYSKELVHANSMFTPKGTDTQPGLLPGGTFVLNRTASQKYFNNKSSLFINSEDVLKRSLFNTGGYVGGFTPQYATTTPIYNNANVNNNQRALSIVNNISVTNKSEQASAQQIAKQITRQVHLGITKLG